MKKNISEQGETRQNAALERLLTCIDRMTHRLEGLSHIMQRMAEEETLDPAVIFVLHEDMDIIRDELRGAAAEAFEEQKAGLWRDELQQTDAPTYEE